jgi:hypothetical protein
MFHRWRYLVEKNCQTRQAKSLSSKLITETHGDVVTGHESKSKKKERIFSSNWWPGMDTEIDIYIKSCDKCLRIRK